MSTTATAFLIPTQYSQISTAIVQYSILNFSHPYLKFQVSLYRCLWYTGYNFSPILNGIVYFTVLEAIWEVTFKKFNCMLV